MNEELESIDTVASVVDRITRRGRFGEFELSNGIVLGIKPVPPLLITAIQKEFKAPPPPKVHIEDQDRWEENPNDPTYQRELTELAERQDAAFNNLLLGMGTSCKSVPDGYYSPEQEGWVASVEFAASLTGQQLEIPPEGIQRYLCWLRFYALETTSDAAIVTSLPVQLGGITEQEVDDVVESFRSISGRDTDTGSETEQGGSNGDRPNRAARRARS